ncbi:cytochrome P450 [Streptomyces sp. NPDC006610]|uniref:cytochrome P450 family protein n=1 Tax=Streptomyces sp. NPDC006610 TaxID=3154584 RepID=UPI0033B4104A
MIAFSTTPTVALDSSGGRCMYDQVDRLRDMGPAVPVQLPEGVAAWSVSRGDVVKSLLTHPGVSRDLKGTVPGYEPGSVAWLSPWVDIDHMATADGKEHARLRRLITPALSPRRVAALRPQIEALVARLLDDIEALPADEPVDLHSAFSYRVPTETICDVFGVPDEQRPELLRLFRAVGETDVASEEESVAISNGLVAAMHALIDARRREPGDDLTSFLIAAREEGSAPLTEDELIATLLLMIGGGSGTTINLIDHTVRELLANPDQLRLVQDSPERWDEAIEESLRVHCPVMHLPMRWATEDIDLGEGVVIRAGDAILICYGAHGRDPGVHEKPDVFDVGRENKDHVAFGLGPHFCPGSRLALLEATVALSALFERFPEMQLAVAPDEVEPEHTFIGNGVASLPVLLHHRSR